MNPLILVAGSNPSRWQLVQRALAGRFPVSFAVDLRGTLDLVARQRPPVLLLSSALLDADVETCLERLSRQHPELQIIVIRDGSADTRPTPPKGQPCSCIDLDAVPEMLEPMVEAMLPSRRPVPAAAARGASAPKGGATAARRDPDDDLFDFPASRPLVLGTSAPMQRVAEVIRRVAPTDVTVLLGGESGTGKELFARRIHCMSLRARGPFRAVSLPSVPAELFESVMFGHERGAFTGAVAQSPGCFEKAQQGTLFLDEISSLKLECQPKLLRAIQEREVERVGAREPLACDVRIIAATNVDLRRMVAEQSFREDLYHRLSVITLELPPLRRHAEDIPALLDFFLRRYARAFNCTVPELAADALGLLQRHRWPGNVRELENRVQRALLLGRRDKPLRAEDLLQDEPERSSASFQFDSCEHSLASVEQAYIERVLEHTEGNQSRAAQLLQIDRKTLRAKLQKYESSETPPVVLRAA